MSVDDTLCSDHSLNASPTQNLHAKIQLRRGFKIVHLNINRLLNKLDAVKEILCSYTSDVLAISETWLSPEIEDSEIQIEDYKVIRKDRQRSSKIMCGGVLIYIRQDIFFHTLNDYSVPGVDSLCCVYRPGDTDNDDFIFGFDKNMQLINEDKSDVVILGDFNIDYSSKRRTSLRKKLDEFGLHHDLQQMINSPTRVTEDSRTMIHLFFTN